MTSQVRSYGVSEFVVLSDILGTCLTSRSKGVSESVVLDSGILVTC